METQVKKIIGLSGYARSGKDTLAYYLSGFRTLKVAGKLREVASILLPGEDVYSDQFKDRFLPAYGMTGREFLQKLGTDAIRDGLHPDTWVLAAMAEADRISLSDVVFTACRFPNEAQAIKDRGGLVIRINRPGITAANAHPSETALDDWNFDAVVENDGPVEALILKAAKLRRLIYAHYRETAKSRL